mmetsp:Transcript_9583/g.20413  ORF Transcript_9583/g.20413 Transcript_9583/m.20413 type:complete len:652 (+) Transcript_9583:75-2030(+)|eukprot:CAMPEP_0202901870 /NCGR_PEP_ID=MMETSP1392-20130828/15082_1 /ASSEMBLY_ACC=CAM_ASM_000868 /TAXON_ID=225041 /ORGANISM="Chlamydomonas chlamydogama, Strain SAG 11-48b" /LENGTH=651 /DNA_ID=CAMNT_0049588515 /DNA_START=73 /DNA_END=2028 /DNA_ORIENTATION=+
MAGRKGSAKSPSKAVPAATPEVAAKVQELKTEAQKLFLSKDFAKAVEIYDQATKALPDGSSDKADLLQKKAGCYMQMKKFKEAVKECSTLLEQQPGSVAALKTRAKAYENMGHVKLALADVQAINSKNPTDETRELEKQLKERSSQNRAKLSGGASAGTKAPANPSYPYWITVKATHGSETKLIQTSIMVSYADLYEAIKAKFPTVGPFVLKYADKEGDVITITSRNDVQQYLGEIVTAYQKQLQGAHAPKLSNNQLPPMRIQVVPVASEAEVPKPPADEVQSRQDLAKGRRDADGQQQPPMEYEIDDWLVQFANLFSEFTGIEPAAFQEHIQQGNEKLTRYLDQTLASEKAIPLFDKAAEHFRDATCTSLVQWGNAFIIKAERMAQGWVRKGEKIEGDKLKAMLKEYDEADKKFQESLRFKAESFETLASQAQLEWERAKANMSFIIPTPQPSEDSGKTAEEREKELHDALGAALKSTLETLAADKVKKVQSHLNKVNDLFNKALGYARVADEKKKKEEEEAEAAKGEAAKKPELTKEQQQAAQMQTSSSSLLIMHGNILYEWSQVLAAVKQEWKAVLDSAVDKFRSAGASETEIRGALKNHSRKDELDLGPDPEPEPAPAPAPAKEEEKAKAPEAKGLPSLEVKKKGKA